MGTSGNTSQNQPTISVLAPLMSAIFAGIVSIVIRVTSRVAAYRTRRYSVSIKQAIFILGHRPSIATSSANKVFHYGVSFAPSPFSAASSVDASSPGRSATSSLNAAWIFSPSASCALLSAAFVFTYFTPLGMRYRAASVTCYPWQILFSPLWQDLSFSLLQVHR